MQRETLLKVWKTDERQQKEEGNGAITSVMDRYQVMEDPSESSRAAERLQLRVEPTFSLLGLVGEQELVVLVWKEPVGLKI